MCDLSIRCGCKGSFELLYLLSLSEDGSTAILIAATTHTAATFRWPIAAAYAAAALLPVDRRLLPPLLLLSSSAVVHRSPVQVVSR